AKGAKGPDTVFDPTLLRKINLTSPQTPGLHVLKALRQGQELRWPAALQEDTLKDARQGFILHVKDALEVAARQHPLDPASGKVIHLELETMNKDLRQRVNDLSPGQFIEARRFLIHMEEALKVVEKGDLGEDLAGQLQSQARTLPELIKFLGEKKLRVGPANPGDEAAYRSLYQALLSYEAALQD